jgi:GNAT superfamily N-acetyltransferase
MATTSASAAARTGVPVLRAYQGPQDHALMVPVANAVRAHNGDPDAGTVPDMDNYYGRFDQQELRRDCAVVEIDGEVVAYGRFSWEPMATGEHLVNGVLFVAPPARGGAIEGLLLQHAIDRADELATRHGGRDIELSFAVADRDPELQAAVEALGFRRVRQFAHLIRPNLDGIPDIPLPVGFEIRPIAADDRAMHRRVWDAGARAFAGSYGEEAPTDRDYERWLEMPSFDPPLWRVAFHGDQIAGQILNYLDQDADDPEGRLGWTESISVQPEFRRRGLARALLAESLRTVRDAGATRAALGADLQNPNQAATLYQSMGFRIVGVNHEYRLGPFPRPRR